MSDLERIKSKFQKIDSSRWWGDDYDVRFYLTRMIKKIKKSVIVDIGGGIGVILSEMDNDNLRINVDISFEDLLTCKKEFAGIQNICASMENLPLREDSVQFVVCANLLEVAKANDLKKNNTTLKNEKIYYNTVVKTLREIKMILKNEGKLFLTTPNNKYYKSTKLDYSELNDSLSSIFENFSIKLFNTYPQLSKSHRKLNLANVIPKFMSKISKREKVIESLLQENKNGGFSISFFVIAEKIQ